jgi:hypothetical protein
MPVPSQSAGYLNDVSLHYHGLQVSPNAPGDDSIDMIAMPGQALHYRVPIPLDHPPGLYWYHSHAHGEAERQNAGRHVRRAHHRRHLVNTRPQVANLPERIIIAREAEPAGGALPAANRKQLLAMRWAMAHRAAPVLDAGMDMRMAERHVDEPARARSEPRRATAQVNPYVDHRSSIPHGSAVRSWPTRTAWEPKRRRRSGRSTARRSPRSEFGRASSSSGGSSTPAPTRTSTSRSTMPNCNSIALDGVPLSSGVNTPASLTVSDYVLPPASRAEFIITGPPAGTQAYLRTLCFDAGSAGPAMPAAVLASIDPTHSPTDASRHRQRVAPNVRSATTSTAFASSRRSPSPPPRRCTIATRIRSTAWPTTRRRRRIFYAQSGTVQEWTIVNNSFASAHVPHAPDPLRRRVGQRRRARAAVRDRQRQHSGRHGEADRAPSRSCSTSPIPSSSARSFCTATSSRTRTAA